MRLCEHPEFERALLAAGEHFKPLNIKASFIEKDYYVTEALREIAKQLGEVVIFKGGTSLSKGWGLIDRFSEDIDLFLDPTAYANPLGKRGIDRELKRLRDIVAGVPGLNFLNDRSQTIGGFGRADRFSYDAKIPDPAIRAEVLVEAGTASGREPTEIVNLTSFLARFLAETGVSLGAEDEGGFPFRLLHFRRTFVEKLFAIHAKIEMMKAGEPLGGYARHYYDLARLSRTPEVAAMLDSDEYERIRKDYDSVSRAHFPRNYFAPEALRFGESDALFPTGDLRDSIAEEYAAQCRVLCYRPFPEWEEIEAIFLSLKRLL